MLPGLVFAFTAVGVLPAQTTVITTAAGVASGDGGVRGFSGDGSAAQAAEIALANLQNGCDPARFEQTSRLAFDAAGNLYFADSNNQRIRRIDSDGIITTVAGSGERTVTNARCDPTGPIGDGAASRDARLFNPSDVLPLPNGNLLIADQQNNRIRVVSPAGVITTVAGSGLHNLFAPGLPAIASPMDWPVSLAVDPSGTVYFAELHGNRVGRIGADGRLSVVAGNGFPGFGGDGASATSAQLRKPIGITFDRAGALYIADTGNHRVRKVVNGIISTIAGTGSAGYSGDDGQASAAMLNTPMDVRVDSKGIVYIADAGNHRIRRIGLDGVITTVAGTGSAGYLPEPDATASPLNLPCAIAVDANDDLYIADWQNFLIRKVTFGGQPVLQSAANAASGARGQMAPGSLISLTGVNLGAESVAVSINGIVAPLIQLSARGVIAQIPWLDPGLARIQVRTPGGAAYLPLTIAPAAPGIFVADGLRPEVRDNLASVLVTGTGAVAPAIEAGQPAPLENPPAAVLPVQATIGGIQAEVVSAALAAGMIGVTRIIVRIPDGLDAPEAPLIITVAGQASNAVPLIIR